MLDDVSEILKAIKNLSEQDYNDKNVSFRNTVPVRLGYVA